MITYGITVSNEEFEFKRLINGLQPYLLDSEEIVVLADANKVTDKIIEHAEICNLKVNLFDFQNNFADYKNQLFELSSKNYLFQIDADEQIPPSLLFQIRLIASNNSADLLWVPRINVVQGATEEHIQKFNWKINQRGWEGFPDYQARFARVNSKIRWQGHVHETLKGAENEKVLNATPPEFYSILHVKHISKQLKQNELYEKI
jgi:glycosyltransferase involved in cell wall biosynthesis